MKIFVVDDSPIIRERLKRMLAEELHIDAIGEAGDARQAIDAILEQKPDVVLLDIHLLNGNGIDVLENVKKAHPAPAVIILTDYPFPEYRARCLDAGADFFFIKSTEFDQVAPAIGTLIQQAREAQDPDNTHGGLPRIDTCSATQASILPTLLT